MTMYAQTTPAGITADLSLRDVMRALTNVSLPEAVTAADLAPFGIFPQRTVMPALLAYQVAVRGEAVLEGGEVLIPYSAADLPLADAKAQARERAKQTRKSHESAGTLFMGMQIATGVEDIAKVAGAESGLMKKPAGATVAFKAESGFVQLDLAAVQGIGLAIYDHIQACFARESALDAAIEAAPDLDALRAINIDAGWPL